MAYFDIPEGNQTQPIFNNIPDDLWFQGYRIPDQKTYHVHQRHQSADREKQPNLFATLPTLANLSVSFNQRRNDKQIRKLIINDS
jgi:hypothetical protein